MATFLQYALLGLGVGAGYALLAQGLVVVYTASGVINFAHGAMGMLGAFTFVGLEQTHGWHFWPAFAVSLALSALIGVLVYQLVMRPLRTASALGRVVATLGLLLLFEGIGLLIWGSLPRIANPIFPLDAVGLGGGITVGKDKFYMVGVSVVTTVGLWAIYRYSRIGLAIRGAAESERGAAALGWSPDLLGSLGWGFGGALAAMAMILISPLSGLQVDDLTLLVIPVLAAGLAGGFTSFPLTFAGAIVIGMCQALLANYASGVQGLPTALPFAVIILFLVVRGKSLPTRGSLSTARLPGLGSGKVNLRALLIATAVFALLVIFVFGTTLVDALTISMAWAIILLSVVVLMGYAGQVDLAPLAWGGIATLIAARLVIDLGFPFELAIVAGVLGTIPVGILFGIPALRARGLNLAIVTLGLGVMLHALVFSNASIVDQGANQAATQVGSQSFLGIDVSGIQHPQRYLLLVTAFFVGLAMIVTNARRGRVGRRMIAVRANERAAGALGISVFQTKLYAFAFSAALAAVGGILLGFRQETISFFDTYAPVQSMQAATNAVIGGVGFATGPLVGGSFAAGGYGGWILNAILPHANPIYVTIFGALTVIVVLIQNPDGLVPINVHFARMIAARVRQAMGRPPRPEPDPGAGVDLTVEDAALVRTPKVLRIDGITVRYGGVIAVQDVSLAVSPGEILGVIGPNGAGKTSLIDALTGFVKPAAGTVTLDGERIDRWPAHRRAQAGLCRSFQSLELFESSTVLENLAVAADPRDMRSYLTDLVRPGVSTLAPPARAAARAFSLADKLDRRADELSYGDRRLVAIARTIAGGPSVLLLDEPAAGLSEHESAELMQMVRRLATQSGTAILLVEHDMAFVMGLCDRVAVLDFGRKIAEGTPAEVRADPAVIEAYLGAPQSDSPKVKV